MISQQAIVSAFIAACNRRDREALSIVSSNNVATKALAVLLKIDQQCQHHQIQITDWFTAPAGVCCWLVLGDEACSQGSTIAPANARHRQSGLAFFRVSNGKIVALDWFLDTWDKLPCAALS